MKKSLWLSSDNCVYQTTGSFSKPTLKSDLFSDFWSLIVSHWKQRLGFITSDSSFQTEDPQQSIRTLIHTGNDFLSAPVLFPNQAGTNRAASLQVSVSHYAVSCYADWQDDHDASERCQVDSQPQCLCDPAG